MSTFEDIVAAAVEAGSRSPCNKSKRGVVIFYADEDSYSIISSGNNAPPLPFVCDGSDACRSSCNKVAIHAEEAAILRALSLGSSIFDADMLHVKVVDGKAVPGGGPSCWQCSRSILKANLSGMWLLHAEGWKYYSAYEFHKQTLIECELHVGVK